MRRLRGLLAGLLLAMSLAPAFAVEPGEELADPALEARARALSTQLRCLVCQNQSIDDSHAALAKDLRLLVRERIKAGDSDAQVRDFLVARYGDFILLKPPLKPDTVLLWAGPFLLLLGGGAAMVAALRRRRAAGLEDPELTPEERTALARITGTDG